jgi:hypothetical protein
MKYAYENLGEDQFEKLIVFLCHELLGVATQGFAKGVDGGRDAKFVGKARWKNVPRAKHCVKCDKSVQSNNKEDRWSEHGLGHLLNPTDPESEDRNWIAQIWLNMIRGALNLKKKR